MTAPVVWFITMLVLCLRLAYRVLGNSKLSAAQVRMEFIAVIVAGVLLIPFCIWLADAGMLHKN